MWRKVSLLYLQSQKGNILSYDCKWLLKILNGLAVSWDALFECIVSLRGWQVPQVGWVWQWGCLHLGLGCDWRSQNCQWDWFSLYQLFQVHLKYAQFSWHCFQVLHWLSGQARSQRWGVSLVGEHKVLKETKVSSGTSQIQTESVFGQRSLLSHCLNRWSWVARKDAIRLAVGTFCRCGNWCFSGPGRPVQTRRSGWLAQGSQKY